MITFDNFTIRFSKGIVNKKSCIWTFYVIIFMLLFSNKEAHSWKLLTCTSIPAVPTEH